jgi:hypothetical protein
VGAGDLLTWAEYEKRLNEWELINRESRISRVYFDGECPPEYASCFAQAPVFSGKPSFMLSTGYVIEI